MSNSSIVSVDTKSGPPHVVLTYDDGPEPVGTQEVLSALSDAQVTATFFVLLTRTRLSPSLTAEIISQGHEIGLHGVDHRSLIGMSAQAVYERTRDAKDELENLIGQSIKWFRPPYGQQTPVHVTEIVKTGLIPVLWNVICRDWEDVTHDDRLEGVRGIQKPGSILLAHDNIACEPDGVFYDPCPAFSRGHLSRSIIEIIREKGFLPCSLAQALEKGEPIWERN